MLGEGGFGTVHKGYIDDNLRQGLKAQAVAVKLLDIEGLQGHREWLVSISRIEISSTMQKHLLYNCGHDNSSIIIHLSPYTHHEITHCI